MWLKFLDSPPGYAMGIFSSGGEGSIKVNGGGVALNKTSGQLFLHFKIMETGSEGFKWEVSANISEMGGKWIHVAGTWDATSEARMYINGNDKGFGHKSAFQIDSRVYEEPKMQVGKPALTFENANFLLDEWYFWDKLLTAEQVVEVYQVYQQGHYSSF